MNFFLFFFSLDDLYSFGKVKIRGKDRGCLTRKRKKMKERKKEMDVTVKEKKEEKMCIKF